WRPDYGSGSLVMSLQVTALMFALPIYVRLTGHPITRREWMWAILLAAALAVVIAVGQPAGGHQRGPLAAWLVVAVVMGPPLLLGLLGARIWSERPVAAVVVAGGGGFVLGAVSGVVEGNVVLDATPPRR